MKKDEIGRSMVEMLGVLAVIGVLSVGGLYGYREAMYRNKANEILQTAGMLAVEAIAKDAGTGDCAKLSTSPLTKKPAGVNVDIIADATTHDSPPTIYIKITDSDYERLCSSIMSIGGNGQYILDHCENDFPENNCD